jgi:broad specificity polyphosphatase/5'/3'-nucleotidase SurE
MSTHCIKGGVKPTVDSQAFGPERFQQSIANDHDSSLNSILRAEDFYATRRETRAEFNIQAQVTPREKVEQTQRTWLTDAEKDHDSNMYLDSHAWRDEKSKSITPAPASEANSKREIPQK